MAYSGLTGKTKKDFGHGEARFVTYMNVYTNTISSAEGVQNIELDSKQHEVKYGDIFFTVSSETPQEVAMASIWLQCESNVYLNSFCFGYRFFNKSFNYLYWGYYLRSPKIRKHFTVLAQGISRYNISKKTVLNTNVIFPRKDEQDKIGSFFKNIDNLIASNQR